MQVTNDSGMTFKIGDQVKVYSAMYPRQMYKGTAEVKDIGPTYEGGQDLLWLKGEVRGAWSPDACELIGEICD